MGRVTVSCVEFYAVKAGVHRSPCRLAERLDALLYQLNASCRKCYAAGIYIVWYHCDTTGIRVKSGGGALPKLDADFPARLMNSTGQSFETRYVFVAVQTQEIRWGGRPVNRRTFRYIQAIPSFGSSHMVCNQGVGDKTIVGGQASRHSWVCDPVSDFHIADFNR